MRLSAAPTDMTQGRPLGLLLRFAIPLLIGNVFQQLYNIVDSLVVGNFVGTEALAAVGISDYPVRVLLALFMGLGTGASIRISQHVGAGNYQGIRRTIQTANLLMLLVGIPLMGIGQLITGPVLRLMNTPPESMEGARVYLSIMFLGVIGFLGYNLNAGILRGLGDSRSSLVFLVVATVVNISLDLLLVVVFHMGVAGAAIATIIAMATSWLLSFLFLRRRYPEYSEKLWPLRLDRDALRDMLRLGLPIGINDALFSLGHMTLSSLVNTHGSAFAAGYNVGTKVDAISFMPIASFSAATTTFVGQNIGAGQMDRIHRGARTALTLTVCWNVFSCAMMILFGRQLVGLFDGNANVTEIGYGYILRLEPFYWIYGIMFILNAVMNGAGEVRMPMVANLVLFWVIRLPAAYLLSTYSHPYNIFLCYPISWFGGFLVSAIYYRTGRWRRHFEKEAPPCEP